MVRVVDQALAVAPIAARSAITREVEIDAERIGFTHIDCLSAQHGRHTAWIAHDAGLMLYRCPVGEDLGRPTPGVRP